MTSSNGIDWAYVVNSPSIALQDIVWSPEISLFVLVGDTFPAIYTSSNGINWTPQPPPQLTTTGQFGAPTVTVMDKLMSVAWSPELDLFVSIDFRGYIITSSNGTNWDYIARPNGNVQGQDIIWVSELNLFVAVYQSGSHRVFTSSNGNDWTKVVVSLNTWNSVAWSPQLSLLCAVADSGTGNRVMTSTDGANWVMVQ